MGDYRVADPKLSFGFVIAKDDVVGSEMKSTDGAVPQPSTDNVRDLKRLVFFVLLLDY